MSNEKNNQMNQPASVAVPNIQKRGMKGFFNDLKRELKQVQWPSRKEASRLTGVVLVVCVITTLILLALSVGIDKVFKLLMYSK